MIAKNDIEGVGLKRHIHNVATHIGKGREEVGSGKLQVTHFAQATKKWLLRGNVKHFSGLGKEVGALF
jgi:hypothetical protein